MNGPLSAELISGASASRIFTGDAVSVVPVMASRLGRLVALALVAMIVASGCATEQPLGPQSPALNVAIGARTVSAEAVEVGDQVVLWTSAYFPPETTFEMIIVGPTRESRAPECPAPYPLYTVMNQGRQSGRSLWWSAQPLSIGTRLSFVRYVADCGGFYVAYAFNVIAVPGK